MPSPLLCLLALAGCATTLVVGEPPADTGDTGAPGVDTSPGAGGVAPEVTGVSNIECTSDQQSAGDLWNLQVRADDPQGPETVIGGTTEVLTADGDVRATYEVVCDEGRCSGNFLSSYDGIGCSLEGRISFRFVVHDEDGNESPPFEYATR